MIQDAQKVQHMETIYNNGNISFEIHRNDKYQIGIVNLICIVNINRIAITTNDFAN